jgi:hypothetical protein
MERNVAGKITDEEARLELREAQAELRQGLKDGSIKLHGYDKALSRDALRASLTTMFGLAIWSGMSDAEAEEVVMKEAERYLENESYYRPKNLLLRYGQAGYYTKDSDYKVVRWAAFAVDLLNPVDDAVAITDLIEDAIKAISDKFNEVEDEANAVIKKNGGTPPTVRGPAAWWQEIFTLQRQYDESNGNGSDWP